MKRLKIVLADMLLGSKVTVEIPGLDTREFVKAIHGRAETAPREIQLVVYADELSDAEKLREITALFQ